MSSELQLLELEAKKTAAKHVATLLQRPDHLDKVDQYRRRVNRKKGSVEAMLKTAVQSQLDGVRSGLTQLLTALQEVKEVKKSLDDIEEAYKKISDQSEKLELIRNENNRHSQLAAAMENLKNIFTVPETVKRTREFINDGKLLHAHKHLTELECSRDDLLFELFKQPKQSPTDHNTLKNYFADVYHLSDELGKQLWFILSRVLDSIRLEPTVIVTTLRIIEREERIDYLWQKRKEIFGFLPPSRPKRWREKCFDVLQDAVNNRVEANQLEERSDNRMWLVRHLEIIRQITTDDLKIIKLVGQPCFPPSYSIFDEYIRMYHQAISHRLLDLISTGDLEGNEIVSLMTWAKSYTSEEMMGLPILEIDTSALPPLLDAKTLKGLEDQYLATVQRNIGDWMFKALTTDMKDWSRDVKPDTDGEGCFTTQLPIFIYEMVQQNLSVAKFVDESLVMEVLNIYFDEVTNFNQSLKEELKKFKEKHMADRNLPVFYVHYLIANINNCVTFVECTDRLNKEFPHPSGDARLAAAEIEFREIGQKGCQYLCDEVFTDLEEYFRELFTYKWRESNVAIDTICITIDDYGHDFVHLKPKYFNYLLEHMAERLLQAYLRAMFSKRLALRNHDDRQEVAGLISRQCNQLKDLFRRAGLPAESRSVFDCLADMNGVLTLRDTSIMSLEVSGLYQKHADMRAEQMAALLALRGDIGTREARELTQEIMVEDQLKPKPSGVFSRMVVPS